MIENWLQWVWLILAMVFFIAEVFTSGFFLICFGVGAGLAAGAAFFGTPPLAQFGIFLVGASLALLAIRPLANRLSNPNTHSVGIDRVLGQEAIVLETIDPAIGHGLVRVRHESWSADAADGRPIAAGTMVVVVDVEGTHLKVRTVG
jgi:membrane protein implicated in regulation of membrane protease activity